MVATRSQTRKNISDAQSHYLSQFISFSMKDFLTAREIGSCLIASKMLYTGLTEEIPCYLDKLALDYYRKKTRQHIVYNIGHLLRQYDLKKSEMSIEERKDMVRSLFDYMLLNLEFIRLNFPSNFLETSKQKLLEFRSSGVVMESKYDVFLI